MGPVPGLSLILVYLIDALAASRISLQRSPLGVAVVVDNRLEVAFLLKVLNEGVVFGLVHSNIRRNDERSRLAADSLVDVLQ